MKRLFSILTIVSFLILTLFFASPTRAATLTVNSNSGSDNDGDAGTCTLREAIAAIESGSDLGNGCGPGTSGDTIAFDVGLDGATIAFDSFEEVTETMTIDASMLSNGITISTNRIILNTPGIVTITHVNFSNQQFSIWEKVDKMNQLREDKPHGQKISPTSILQRKSASLVNPSRYPPTQPKQTL